MMALLKKVFPSNYMLCNTLRSLSTSSQRFDRPIDKEDFKSRLEKYGKVTGNTKKQFKTGSSESDEKNPHVALLSRIHNLEQMFKSQEVSKLKSKQSFDPTIVDRLGPDLAAANFLLSRGAAVRFQGATRMWDSYLSWKIPDEYDPSYVLEAIYLLDFPILPVAFDTIDNLKYLKEFHAPHSESMTDGILDAIGAQFGDSLEFLDISHCEMVSANGVASLAKARALRRLKVEGLSDVTDMQLTCLLLTEANPNLIIEGLYFEEDPEDDGEYIGELDTSKLVEIGEDFQQKKQETLKVEASKATQT